MSISLAFFHYQAAHCSEGKDSFILDLDRLDCITSTDKYYEAGIVTY